LRLGRRWQSTEAEKTDGSPPSEAKPVEATEEDPTKKELEAKNKEIIDLKVGREWFFELCGPTLTMDRTSISAQ
jgi:hypothetical protein